MCSAHLLDRRVGKVDAHDAHALGHDLRQVHRILRHWTDRRYDLWVVVVVAIVMGSGGGGGGGGVGGGGGGGGGGGLSSAHLGKSLAGGAGKSGERALAERGLGHAQGGGDEPVHHGEAGGSPTVTKQWRVRG